MNNERERRLASRVDEIQRSELSPDAKVAAMMAATEADLAERREHLRAFKVNAWVVVTAILFGALLLFAAIRTWEAFPTRRFVGHYVSLVLLAASLTCFFFTVRALVLSVRAYSGTR